MNDNAAAPDWADEKADELLLMVAKMMIARPEGHLELIHRTLAAELRFIREQGADEGQRHLQLECDRQEAELDDE